MTRIEPASATAAVEPPKHPLDPLTPDEIQRVRDILTSAGHIAETTRFPLVQLAEPPKDEVLGRAAGEVLDRQVRCVLLDVATGEVAEVVVSVLRNVILQHERVDTDSHGQPPIMAEEFTTVDEIVKDDADWRTAMARRGVHDLDRVRVCPLSAGSFGIDGEQGRRMLRALSFWQDHDADSPWAHPIDGVVAYVDVLGRCVLEVNDEMVRPIPRESGNYADEAVTGPPRSTLKPVEITQPEGPSFTVAGNHVHWENWDFRVSFDPREGLVLHQISFTTGGAQRPVIYRASISEMVVNYGDPSPVRFWQNYFDAGEYSLGKSANELSLGCDCLGEIYYFDAVLADDHCRPRTLNNAVCMHEEDYGVLWKHTDVFTGSTETRRQRRLVVSFFVTVGNYDYGFYWYFYLDGTIELETKATGIVFTSSYEPDSRWASEVAPGLGAPYHQHLFSARLDMMVDGISNAVEEQNAARVPMSTDNPHGNAFTRQRHRLSSEQQAMREADPGQGREWHVINPDVRNRIGQPVGYALHPQGTPVLLADANSSIAQRAGFATKHLWVTRYDPAQRYASAEYINQHAGGGGLPAHVAQDRDINGTDLVLWHTFGLTHFPRPEDWPIMPVDYCGFTLKPVGFFDSNPTLDVPRSASKHCVDSRSREDPECCD